MAHKEIRGLTDVLTELTRGHLHPQMEEQQCVSDFYYAGPARQYTLSTGEEKKRHTLFGKASDYARFSYESDAVEAVDKLGHKIEERFSNVIIEERVIRVEEGNTAYYQGLICIQGSVGERSAVLAFLSLYYNLNNHGVNDTQFEQNYKAAHEQFPVLSRV